MGISSESSANEMEIDGVVTPEQETTAEQADAHARKRVALACTRCRKRKIKCSGEGDPKGCSSCQGAGEEGARCTFWRMGTSHEVVWTTPNHNGNRLEQMNVPTTNATAGRIDNPQYNSYPGTAPPNQSGYAEANQPLHAASYGPPVPLHIQTSFPGPHPSNPRSAEYTSPSGYEPPVLSSAQYPHRPFVHNRSENSPRDHQAPVIPFGYDNSNIELYGPRSRPGYPVQGRDRPHHGDNHSQHSFHGLPPMRNPDEPSDISPHSIPPRQLPRPEPSRQHITPSSSIAEHMRGSFVQDLRCPDSISDYNSGFRQESYTGRHHEPYPEMITAPMGYIFHQGPPSNTSPTSASHRSPPYVVPYPIPRRSSAAHAPSYGPLVIGGDERRESSSYGPFDFSSDPARYQIYNNAAGLQDFGGGTLVSGHRYAPLNQQPRSAVRRQSSGIGHADIASQTDVTMADIRAFGKIGRRR